MISGMRIKSKKAMSDALVAHRATKERQAVTGTLEVLVKRGEIMAINTKCYLNRLFGEKIKTKIAICDCALTRGKLKDNMSTYHLFHEEMVDDYSNKGNTIRHTLE